MPPPQIVLVGERLFGGRDANVGRLLEGALGEATDLVFFDPTAVPSDFRDGGRASPPNVAGTLLHTFRLLEGRRVGKVLCFAKEAASGALFPADRLQTDRTRTFRQFFHEVLRPLALRRKLVVAPDEDLRSLQVDGPVFELPESDEEADEVREPPPFRLEEARLRADRSAQVEDVAAAFAPRPPTPPAAAPPRPPPPVDDVRPSFVFIPQPAASSTAPPAAVERSPSVIVDSPPPPRLPARPPPRFVHTRPPVGRPVFTRSPPQNSSDWSRAPAETNVRSAPPPPTAERAPSVIVDSPPPRPHEPFGGPFAHPPRGFGAAAGRSRNGAINRTPAFSRNPPPNPSDWSWAPSGGNSQTLGPSRANRPHDHRARLERLRAVIAGGGPVQYAPDSVFDHVMRARMVNGPLRMADDEAAALWGEDVMPRLHREPLQPLLLHPTDKLPYDGSSCVVCLEERPHKPVACRECRKGLGCFACLKRWCEDEAGQQNRRSCPLCRGHWGAAPQVAEMTISSLLK
ncbi:hypothetical protein M3Y99_00974700 [Aphelenchoides fujianensis]|nr:hypothetical protein M3Y99_00974700 [Aphelenchoides fujianensis]